jgi:hypothetical protein
MTRFENMDIFRVALRRKWMMVTAFFAGGLLGYIFSGPTFIPPKYKSSAIVYPVNILPYSMESPTEQLLQLFHSADVRQMMVEKFNLPAHYTIDTNASAGKTRLFNLFDENVQVRKTEFESIKIDVYDTDPDTACAMVNGLIDCVNLKARRLQRGKTKEVVKIFSEQLKFKQHQIDSLERIMSVLRVRYGLLDYDVQSKETTKSYLKLVSGGASRDKMQAIDTMMHNLEEKGGDLVAVSEQLDGLRDAYNEIKTEYDRSVSDLTKELTYSNVIARPFPADSKAYPIRSLIALICSFSALMFSLLVFAVIDRRTKPDAQHDPQ